MRSRNACLGDKEKQESDNRIRLVITFGGVAGVCYGMWHVQDFWAGVGSGWLNPIS